MALCFVAVLGISLAGYIAVCSRAMTLSNRSFQGNLSQELAELGLEEALRAFNKNDWSDWSNGGVSVDWDTSTYSASKRAVATLTFSSGKLGQGATATVKIRVDNYDAAVVGSTWSSSANYRNNDLVGRNGIWYRCLTSHSNQTPIPIMGTSYVNMKYWVAAPVPSTWSSGITYKNEDVAYYTTNNKWFRYTNGTATAGNAPPGSGTSNTYWTQVPNFTTFAAYTSNNDIISYPLATTWYRWDSSLGWQNAEIAWRWRSGASYAFNDLVLVYSTTSSTYTWWRCINPHTSSGGTFSAGSNWENALTGMWGWSSGIGYNLGDAVYYSATSQWYRCIKAHTSSASIIPTNTTYWSNTPLFSTAWDSGRQYSQNDTARYNGVWYLSLQSSNVGQNPATATTYWIGANTSNASYTWNTSTSYSAGAYSCYGGVWYKCLVGHSNKSPNDTTYWTPTWANGAGITTGAPVAYAEAAVSIANSPTVKTQLRAPLAPAPQFPNAAGALSTLSASSGGTVDSYDSVTDPSAATRGYSAVLAAGSTSGTAVTLSSPTVKGYVAAPSSTTSPYAPLFSYGTSAVVKGTSATPSPKVDPTRVSRSPSIPAFSPLPSGGLATNWATVPKGTALALATTITIGTPGATTPSRFYYNGDLTIGDATTTNLIINGPVILYINGDLILTATGASVGRIDINSSGSAEIHVADSLKVDATSEGIYNRTLDPKKLIVICDTAASSTQYYSDGSYPFYGVLYLPYTTNASGLYNNNNTAEFYGALSANNITFSGANLNLHYDTSLRYATFGGVDQPYAVTEWRELPVTEQATMP